jgi:flagellar basal-body rod modification protein FlgD
VTIDPTTAAGANTAATNTPATAKADPLGRDAFMNLLVTQLQHQDPTSPQPDGEFLAQLAQFSSLEQLQTANKTLTQISSVFTALQPAAASTSTSSTNNSATTPTEGKA